MDETRIIDITSPVYDDLANVRKVISKADYIPTGVPEQIMAQLTPRVPTVYSSLQDLLTGDTRLSVEQTGYLEKLETALAVFRITARELRKEMDIVTLENLLSSQGESAESDDKAGSLKREISDKIFFSNRYALYFAGQVGLSLLESEKPDVKALFSFGKKYDASKDMDQLASILSSRLTKDFLEVAAAKLKDGLVLASEDLKSVLQTEFTQWINQFEWSTYSKMTEGCPVENLHLKYGNYSISAGAFKRKYDTVVVDERFMRVHKEDIINSREFVDTTWQNLLRLGMYDFERQKNEFNPPFVQFTFGAPGGGKSYDIHALIRSYAELCASKGIAFWGLVHNTTDYASEFQNQTANRLAKQGGDVRDFPGLVVMYIADADNIFGSRADPNLTAEQRQTLSVYFSMLDGTLIPKIGKTMIIMDANYISGIDEATKTRIFDEVLELKRWTDPAHFAELAKRTVSSGLTLGIQEKEWLEIGDFILSTPVVVGADTLYLSNREVVSVLKQSTRNFPVNEDLLGAAFDIKHKFRNDQLKAVTKDSIIATFQGYMDTRMRIERDSRENLMRQRKERFLTALNEEHKTSNAQ